MKELQKGERLELAALRSGMSETTAARYRDGAAVKGQREARQYRTRPSPFARVWPEIETMLEQSPGLEAKTIFELLGERGDLDLQPGQLRTLQRHIRVWRGKHGPQKEVMFPQEHRPGEAAQSDFTWMNELGITIGGEQFDHLCYHFVLPYSNWEWVMVCFAESYETLTEGFQRAVHDLGGVPRKSRTDNLSAATHKLTGGGREFNERYTQFLAYYGCKPDRNTPGRGHENGDVEQAHHRFKRAVGQALLVRGTRDFADRASYEAFLATIVAARNAKAVGRFGDERRALRPLPAVALESFRRVSVKVTAFSTVHLGANTYSVPSRLIGEYVEARLDAESVEIWYGGERMAAMERLRGRGGRTIDYRHVIWSLVRKPGAFARYRFREALFPSLVFRQAYDALEARLGGRADVEYVRILHLAASTSETQIEQILDELVRNGALENYAQVRALGEPREIAIPECGVIEPDLGVYDALAAVEVEA
jgi:hypothetical protein